MKQLKELAIFVWLMKGNEGIHIPWYREI